MPLVRLTSAKKGGSPATHSKKDKEIKSAIKAQGRKMEDFLVNKEVRETAATCLPLPGLLDTHETVDLMNEIGLSHSDLLALKRRGVGLAPFAKIREEEKRRELPLQVRKVFLESTPEKGETVQVIDVFAHPF